MIIKHCHINKFRLLENTDFNLGLKLTAITGHNGTLKTTMLGILSQTFSIGKSSPLYGIKSIDNYNFKSQFSDKFKLTDKDKPGEHSWKIDLYPGIYKNDCFEAISVRRSENNNSLRFVSVDGKKKGNGYIQIPVYYLSLKRVIPIGEETRIKKNNVISIEDKKFLIDEYKEIMGVNHNSIAESLNSSNKRTISLHDKNMDAETISAGQDNIGKILMVILSFKKINDEFKDDYKGGLVLIDEIESTLHPEAQRNLIHRLAHYSGKYNIQFIYTTHSPTVVSTTNEYCNKNNDAKIICMKRIADSIKCFENNNINKIISELKGEVLIEKLPRLTIFTEDEVGKNFLKSILNGYCEYISFSNVSIGAEEYLNIVQNKLININECWLVLDGDKNVTKNKTIIKKLNTDNILFLPGSHCPERVIYEYLNQLDENDAFWDNNLGGYDKHKCFGGYCNPIDDSNYYKKWYKNNKKYWGNGCKKIFDRWKKDNKDEVNDFCNKFVKKYNSVFNENIVKK